MPHPPHSVDGDRPRPHRTSSGTGGGSGQNDDADSSKIGPHTNQLSRYDDAGCHRHPDWQGQRQRGPDRPGDYSLASSYGRGEQLSSNSHYGPSHGQGHAHPWSSYDSGFESSSNIPNNPSSSHHLDYYGPPKSSSHHLDYYGPSKAIVAYAPTSIGNAWVSPSKAIGVSAPSSNGNAASPSQLRPKSSSIFSSPARDGDGCIGGRSRSNGGPVKAVLPATSPIPYSGGTVRTTDGTTGNGEGGTKSRSAQEEPLSPSTSRVNQTGRRGRSRRRSKSRGDGGSSRQSKSSNKRPRQSNSFPSDGSRRMSSLDNGTDAIDCLPVSVCSYDELLAAAGKYYRMLQNRELPPQHLIRTSRPNLEKFRASRLKEPRSEMVLLPDSIDANLVYPELSSDATAMACIYRGDPNVVNMALLRYDCIVQCSPAISPRGLFTSLLRKAENLVGQSRTYESTADIVRDVERVAPPANSPNKLSEAPSDKKRAATTGEEDNDEDEEDKKPSSDVRASANSHAAPGSPLASNAEEVCSGEDGLEARTDVELNNASDDDAPREGGDGDVILIDEASERRDDDASHGNECGISSGFEMQDDHSINGTESTEPTVVADPPSGTPPSGMNVKVPASSQSLDGIIRDLSLPAATANAASALCSFPETDLAPYASRAGELISQFLELAQNHQDQEVRSHAKRLSKSMTAMGQIMRLVTTIDDAARSKDFPCLVKQLQYVYALNNPLLLRALLENGGIDALHAVILAFPGTYLASFAYMNIGRLMVSKIGATPKGPIPPLDVGAPITEKYVLAMQALENLGLKEDPLRPSMKSFAEAWLMYKPELNRLKYGSGSRDGEELTLQQAYAAKPRFVFDMTEFDDDRSDIAKLVSGLSPSQDMIKALHRRFAVQCSIPADSSLDLGKVRGHSVVIFLHNFPTQTGGAALVQKGLMCGEGDYCLTSHQNIMSCLERIGMVPPGATDQFERRVVHFDTNPTIAPKSWSSSQGDMPCSKAEADAVVQSYLGRLLLALVDALKDDYGVTEILIVRCGNQAAKAFDRIDYDTKQKLSARINRAMDNKLKMAHAWTLVRDDKPDGVLEDHVSGMQRIGCYLRNTEKIKLLNSNDFAIVVYNCKLSAKSMSEERRSARGIAAAATRRRNEAKMSADEKAALAQKRSDAVSEERLSARAIAAAATRRRNEDDMSADEKAALAQKRSDAVVTGHETRRRSEDDMSADEKAALAQKRSDAGSAAAATRRRSEDDMSADEKAALVQKRSDAGSAAGATRRRNEAKMSADEKAALVQKRSDQDARSYTMRGATYRRNRLKRAAENGEEVLPQGISQAKSGSYESRAYLGGKEYYIGRYGTLEEAVAARQSVVDDLAGVDFWSLSPEARKDRISEAKNKATGRKKRGPPKGSRNGIRADDVPNYTKLDSNSHGTLLYRYTEAISAGADPDSDSEDDDMSVGEDEDTATLAAAAVAAAVAAGDATAYAASLQEQKKLAAFSVYE